jgi:tRNA A37 threonylcarbamoyladenosine biosynthesis protein TsaE
MEKSSVFYKGKMTDIVTKKLDVELPERKTGGVSFCLIGSTRSGKTTLLKHVLKEYFDKHITVLMSNSIHAPIYNEIEGCIKSPVYSHKVIKEGYEINRKTKNHYPLLYVLDDVVDKKNDRELLKLLTIYRNSGLSTIISLQSPILMNTAGRGNVNFVCLGKMNSDENIEKVVRMYLMSFLKGKIDDKIRQYKMMTEDHFWILVNNLTGEVSRFKIKV